jgi:hypothetical protein
MTPVVSDGLLAVGYDPAERVLRVAFRSGGVYDYLDVDEDLYAELLLPHPWHRVGDEVLSHEHRRVRQR